MGLVRTAVVGIGYLGQYHAEKYSALPSVKLVAVCDLNQARCQELAQTFGAQAVFDYRELIGKVDAVSIVAPTPLHHAIGRFFLEHGVHVLMEKPIAVTLSEADALIALAKKNHVILQVGHLEQFNNALKAAKPLIQNPQWIEAIRLAPFKVRGSDVSVILDLMIHDIDIVLSLANSPIKNISANGFSLLTSYIDLAHARIEFENDCIADITASRIHTQTERKLNIFQQKDYLLLDLDAKKITHSQKAQTEIQSETRTIEKGDALKDEITDFIDCILHKKAPLVSGEKGRQALAVALHITKLIEQRQSHPEIFHAS